MEIAVYGSQVAGHQLGELGRVVEYVVGAGGKASLGARGDEEAGVGFSM
jgi:hypothetical protein